LRGESDASADPHWAPVCQPLSTRPSDLTPNTHKPTLSNQPRRRITVRKSRYDLGKKFFTNITPGYQQYPVVQLLPWTDPDAPGGWLIDGSW